MGQQGGFAPAGFPVNENNTAVPGHRLLQAAAQSGEFLLPPGKPAHRPLYKQERAYQRAVALLLAEEFAFSRHSVTHLLLTLGVTEGDWSSWYRLFSRQQFDEPAFRYSLAAGDDAGYLFALQDAVTHYENARRLLVEGRAPTIELRQIRRLYLQLSLSLALLKLIKEASVHFRELADLGKFRGETDLTVAALNAEGTITSLLYETRDHHRALMVASQALDLARTAGDEVAEARAPWNHLLIERTSAANLSRGISFVEEAVALARRTEDQELLAILFNDLATIYTASGRGDIYPS